MTIVLDGTANTISGLSVGGIGAVVNSSSIVDGSIAAADLALEASSLGYGQTWQNVTRNVSTNYYNTTGRPIQVVYTAVVFNGQLVTLAINSVSVAATGNDNISTSIRGVLTAIVPAGAVYSLSGNFNSWVSQVELR